MNGFELLKHLAQRFTATLHGSTTDIEVKNKSLSQGPPNVTNRWLGVVPFAIRYFFNPNKKGK